MMRAVTIDFYLCQPVLVAITEPGDENSAEGLAYLPGSSIRGALISLRLAQQRKSRLDLQKDVKEKSWFFQDLCFLNAYPLHPGGERMLPTPLSWRVEKDYRRSPNAAIEDAASGAPVTFDSPATLPDPFFTIKDGQPQLLTPGRTIRIHNSSWSRHIKGQGISQVFRYEALSAGQIFRAVILGESSKELVDALGLQNETCLSIGRSRSGDYGDIEVKDIKFVDWNESQLLVTEEKPKESDRLFVILTSDAILKDDNGQPVLNPDHLIGQKAVETFYRTRVTGGFNRAWGMPLPQEIALQAGSVFVYNAHEVDLKKINQLMVDGIGQKRLEGNGQLRAVLNPPAKMQRKELSHSPSGNTVPRPLDEDLALKIGVQYLQNLLEEKLASAVAKLTLLGMQDRAQLGRLRNVARYAQDQDNPVLFKRHLNDLKSAKDKIRNARLKKTSERSLGPRLNDWVDLLVAEAEDSVFWQSKTAAVKWGWQEFLAPDAAERADIIGLEPKDQELMKLKRNVIIRFIDGLMNKAARESQQQQREEGNMEASHVNN